MMRLLEDNNITIHWTEALKKIGGLIRNKANHIILKRDIIPIIFVPGFMGTKLKKNNEMVWDPDDLDLMEEYYFWDSDHGAARQKLLIGKNRAHDPKYLEVAYPESLKPDAKDLGWANVFSGSYGALERELKHFKAKMPLECCFEYVAHAFGYNWTACNSVSGAKLNEYIDHILDYYSKKLKDRRCEKVILITHSMGGLVARSACQQGAESKVLGVVHGVQPVHGSPASYWRMKAGFSTYTGEYTASGQLKRDGFLKSVWTHGWDVKAVLATPSILGPTGPYVTALLPYMPGALELLPTSHYQTNGGNKEWLSFTQGEGKGTRQSLPKSDPYAEIYGEQEQFYRLIEPQWLVPEKALEAKEDRTVALTNAWDVYMKLLRQAEAFHKGLNNYQHPDTYQFYTSDVITADRIDYRRSLKNMRGKDVNDLFYLQKEIQRASKKGERANFSTYTDASGKTLMLDKTLMPDKTLILIDYYKHTLAEPSSHGDGTVPTSSGNGLDVEEKRNRNFNQSVMPWREQGHERVYGAEPVLRSVTLALHNFGVSVFQKKQKKFHHEFAFLYDSYFFQSLAIERQQR